MITEKQPTVKTPDYYANPSRTTLVPGANVKRGKHAPPPPEHFVLDIGKAVSLELTAERYGFSTNGGGK